MSRQSTKEYILEKRRVYHDASAAKKVSLLNEVCETTGHSRNARRTGYPRSPPVSSI